MELAPGKLVRGMIGRRGRDSRPARAARYGKGLLNEVVWRAKGRSGPPPNRVKRRIIRLHAQRYGCATLVETGTYRGDTVAELSRRLDRVVSIELSHELYEAAARRFAGLSNVTLIEGDSAAVLPGVVRALRAPAVFWLDGHWSGGVTARGRVDSPVSEELAAILASHIPHVVLIDDARHFDGTSGYPTLAEVEDAVSRGRVPRTTTLEDDVIRLCPVAS